MKRSILSFFCCFIFAGIAVASPLTWKSCRDHVLSEDFDKAVIGYAQLIEDAQKQRTGTKGVDGDLIAEYAVALAFSGIYDGALMNIDRARMLDGKNADFYTALILNLMCYPDLAVQFWEEDFDGAAPAWIARQYKAMIEKFRRTPAINSDEADTAFVRANALAANSQCIQSIVIFQEICDNYPEDYLPFVGYSIVWEKMNNYSKAAEVLEHGISLMSTENNDDAVSAFNNHLVNLHNEIVFADNKSWMRKTMDRYEPSMMLYAGGAVGKGSFELNSRLGFYTNNKVSGSVNLGYSLVGKESVFNIGFAGYKTLNVFVFGIGINEQIGKDSVFSIAPSAGISLLNRKGNASYDIMLNLMVPCKKGNPVSFSVSFGRTFYFNYKGKRR